MKSFKLLLPLIVLAAVAAAPVVRADTTTPPASSAEASLTPEQQAKITELRKTAHDAVKKIKADGKATQADKTEKIKAIKAQLQTDIAAVKAGK